MTRVHHQTGATAGDRVVSTHSALKPESFDVAPASAPAPGISTANISTALMATLGLAALPQSAGAAVPARGVAADDAPLAQPSRQVEHFADHLAKDLADRHAGSLTALGVDAQAKPDHLVQWAQCSSSYCGPSYATLTDAGATGQQQMITNRVLANVLLGGNEQINCNNCFSMFGSVGSATAGAHGRYNLTPQLSLLGGIAISRYDGKTFRADALPTLAVALRYDLADWGWSRPYVDVGLTTSPSQRFRFRRDFATLGGTDTALGRTRGQAAAAFAKLGWVFRATQRDEIAVFGELWRSWQRVDSFTEETFSGSSNFIRATSDQMSIAKVGAQWTHLWGSSIETHLNGGVARTFGSSVGMLGALTELGNPAAPLKERTYFEYGARIGYRVTPKLVLDVFANGAAIGGPIGNQVHVGSAIRYHF